MKLKSKEKKIKFISKLSPNYQSRGNYNIKFIIIHYTGIDTLERVFKILLNKKSKLSCHWLITKKGTIYKIVDEKNIAWHAGKSFWKGEFNINNTSIGIELENPGHGKNYINYSKKQMDALEEVIINIKLKYKIKIENILGHSDIAPDRKADPGEYFDWQRLAKKKAAFWPAFQKVKNNKIIFQLGAESKEIVIIKKKLMEIGYKCNINKKFDLELKVVIEAFQRKFLQDAINGIIDTNLVKRINSLVKKT